MHGYDVDPDLVIVGGGIGGAVLACLVGRAGKRVVVLERSAGPPDWVRPEILWPATVGVLSSLIPRSELEREALLSLQGITVAVGEQKLLSITPERLREFEVQPRSTDPNRTRELLLRLGSFELRRGVEVTGVLKQGSRIEGVRFREITTGAEGEVLARLTVGDDGAQSVVRRACGIEIRTRMFPLDFLCLGFRWPSSLPPARGRVWLDRRRGSRIFALLALPLPGERGAGVVLARPEVFDGSREVQGEWRGFAESDAVIQEIAGERAFPEGFVRVRRPWGHAARYGSKGAVLLGDAIHPVSPAGGQGANMSVADAVVLAELLLAGEAPLDEYERRRRAANERSLLFTRRASMVLGLARWLPINLPVSHLLRWVDRHPSVLRRVLRFASTAFQEGRAT